MSSQESCPEGKLEMKNNNSVNVRKEHSSGEGELSLVSRQQGLQPTERPWAMDDLMISQGVEQTSIINKKVGKWEGGFICSTTKANAELIVRAVNAHDALVKAVQFALTTPGLIKGRDELKAALALATNREPE